MKKKANTKMTISNKKTFTSNAMRSAQGYDLVGYVYGNKASDLEIEFPSYQFGREITFSFSLCMGRSGVGHVVR